MAAITNYGYSNLTRRVIDASPSYQDVVATVQIGDGALTYPTGGLAIDRASLGFSVLIEFVQFIDSPIVGGYFPRYNSATGKVQLLDNTGTEIANSSTPNASFRILARGY